MLRFYLQDFIISVIDKTYYVLQCVILMRGMLIGKSLEHVFTNWVISDFCMLRFKTTLAFLSAGMFQLYVEMH